MKLIYKGDGKWIAGVPARNLNADDVKSCSMTHGELVGSGLYEEAGRRAKRTAVEPDEIEQEQIEEKEIEL